MLTRAKKGGACLSFRLALELHLLNSIHFFRPAVCLASLCLLHHHFLLRMYKSRWKKHRFAWQAKWNHTNEEENHLSWAFPSIRRSAAGRRRTAAAAAAAHSVPSQRGKNTCSNAQPMDASRRAGGPMRGRKTAQDYYPIAGNNQSKKP